jgi:hypothetical protein
MFLRDNFRRSTKGAIDRRSSQVMLAARTTRGCDVLDVPTINVGLTPVRFSLVDKQERHSGGHQS